MVRTSYALASTEAGMTPTKTTGKALRKNGELTGECGDPVSDCAQASNQMRGRAKGPHKQQEWRGQGAEALLLQLCEPGWRYGS
jgi:hypothetical protein